MADSKGLFTITDRTAEFEKEDAQQNKVMGILAYIGILVLVPIFAAKDSKFARFHANQGLVLAIFEVASYLIFSVILSMIPKIGWLFGVIGWIISVGLVVLAVLGIVAAARGQAKELPIVGQIKILK
ncbi:MAG: zinc ribbon domain-containing protein [Clostridia bacterium]|nr:zinc ribbon domain-containing protein [Clostridia bacterium]